MTDKDDMPKEAVIALMKGAVPERESELTSLWERYKPDLALIADARRITLNANKDRIAFDIKTMDVFWLIAFGGWRAIECYSPHVILSVVEGRTVADVMRADTGLDEVERDYKERRAAAQALIDAPDPASARWPPDLPRPSSDRNARNDPQYQVAFDFVCLAVAFAVFHEFHHVMLDRDQNRPADRREEEMACDVWARDFMTANIERY